MRKASLGKQILSVTMAAALMLGTNFPTINAFAKEASVTEYTPVEVDAKNPLLKKDSNATVSAFNPDEEVTIIVELSEKPLAESYSSRKQSMSFETYLRSSNAKTVSGRIETEQKNTIKKINDVVDTEGNVQVLYKYDTLINGFAIKTKYSELDKIKKLSNVKNAHVSRMYSRPAITKSGVAAGATDSGDQESYAYTGSGKLVAVIDTGLETGHEAFATVPEEVKYSKADVQSLMNEANLNAKISSADSVYVSGKVVFAYDYADHDTNVNPTVESLERGNAHGTHVAGIIAGNSEKFQGIAKDSQLAIFKVFSDWSDDAFESNIIAGIEDAVSLGVDAINLSLGSTAGFPEPNPEKGGIEVVYSNLLDTGISVLAAAGNENSIAEYNNNSNLIFSSNPDTAVVCDPSTYGSALSVASVNSSKILSKCFLLGEEKIPYQENANDGAPLFSSLDTEEYIYVPGDGNADDYEGLDLTGKIAVVKRGGIPFDEKLTHAREAGAIALIVVNNQPGTIGMALTEENYVIPAIMVSNEYYDMFLEADEKTITISNDVIEADNPQGNLMSSFSSWGPSVNLDLKPEITAPGGSIYSSVPFGNYDCMDGTSMATPYIAGATTLVRARIENDLAAVEEKEMAKIIDKILMSTADPIKDTAGEYYSPRKQGSGVVDVAGALSTNTYLFTSPTDNDPIGRPKLNLYDDFNKTGIFESTFYIKNIGDTPATYTVSNESLVEAVYDDAFITEASVSVSDMVTFSVNDGSASQITVAANSTEEIKVKWELSNELVEYYNEYFENGEFFEGYVFLTPEGDEAELSIPYLGFYGDWCKAPIFDTGTVYDYLPFQQVPTSLITKNMIVGVNQFDEITCELLYGDYSPIWYGEYYETALAPDYKKIAISAAEDSVFDSIEYASISLLRNAKSIEYTIKDSEGNVVLSGSEENIRKTFITPNGANALNLDINFSAKDNGQPRENNSVYTLEIKANLGYADRENSNDTLTFPITIDNESPVINSIKEIKEDGKTYLEVNAVDNQYIQCVSLYTGDEDGEAGTPNELVQLEAIPVCEEKANTLLSQKIDVTEFVSAGGKIEDIRVEVVDYATNYATYKAEKDPVEEIKVGAVKNLAVKSFTPSKITLSWDKTKNATGYIVYGYNTKTKKYEKINSTGKNTFTVTKVAGKALKSGTKYKLKVRAYINKAGKNYYGAYSSLTATTKVAKVTDVKLTSKKRQNLSVAWKKVTGAKGYQIAISTKAKTGYKAVGKTTKLKFIKKKLNSGKKYYVKVRAYQVINKKTVYGAYSKAKAIKIK